MSLRDKLNQIKVTGLKNIAQIENIDELNKEVKVNLLGKKGKLTILLRDISKVPVKERAQVGKDANTIKKVLNEALNEKKRVLENKRLEEKLESERIDVTLPGNYFSRGHQHLVQNLIDKIEKYFIGMGYQVLIGPEIENDYYNFERMNLPSDHPARDMQDTFYLNKNLLMRTHTSPMQARSLETHNFNKGPLKMISPGIVYRRDTDDPTHSHQFHQIEGMVVSSNISLSNLKGTLKLLLRKLFGNKIDIRFRPSYFPFTEPSIEADIRCFKCNGKGCNVCKGKGWIEVLGAGMVHPNVLKMSGVDPNKYRGFAFGIGVDRLALLQYEVSDIRDLYLNNLKVLTQFD